MAHTKQERPPRLTEDDLRVIRDILRFGWLAADQIARRYRKRLPAGPKPRIARLKRMGLLNEWDEKRGLTRPVYMPTDKAASIVNLGLTPAKPTATCVFHNLTAADVADYILKHEPGSVWITERELSLKANRELRRSLIVDEGHQPDGILIDPDRLYVGVEIELTINPDYKYARVCRWFAAQPRIDRLRWYVSTPRLRDKIIRVVREYGLANDIGISINLLPPGVVLRD